MERKTSENSSEEKLPFASGSESADSSDSEQYAVDKIVGRKIENGNLKYKIRWENYGPENDSWEPVEHLRCPEKVAAYEKVHGKVPNETNFNKIITEDRSSSSDDDSTSSSTKSGKLLERLIENKVLGSRLKDKKEQQKQVVRRYEEQVAAKKGYKPSHGRVKTLEEAQKRRPQTACAQRISDKTRFDSSSNKNGNSSHIKVKFVEAIRKRPQSSSAQCKPNVFHDGSPAKLTNSNQINDVSAKEAPKKRPETSAGRRKSTVNEDHNDGQERVTHIDERPKQRPKTASATRTHKSCGQIGNEKRLTSLSDYDEEETPRTYSDCHKTQLDLKGDNSNCIHNWTTSFHVKPEKPHAGSSKRLDSQSIAGSESSVVNSKCRKPKQKDPTRAVKSATAVKKKVNVAGAFLALKLPTSTEKSTCGNDATLSPEIQAKPSKTSTEYCIVPPRVVNAVTSKEDEATSSPEIYRKPFPTPSRKKIGDSGIEPSKKYRLEKTTAINDMSPKKRKERIKSAFEQLVVEPVKKKASLESFQDRFLKGGVRGLLRTRPITSSGVRKITPFKLAASSIPLTKASSTDLLLRKDSVKASDSLSTILPFSNTLGITKKAQCVSVIVRSNAPTMNNSAPISPSKNGDCLTTSTSGLFQPTQQPVFPSVIVKPEGTKKEKKSVRFASEECFVEAEPLKMSFEKEVVAPLPEAPPSALKSTTNRPAVIVPALLTSISKINVPANNSASETFSLTGAIPATIPPIDPVRKSRRELESVLEKITALNFIGFLVKFKGLSEPQLVSYNCMRDHYAVEMVTFFENMYAHAAPRKFQFQK